MRCAETALLMPLNPQGNEVYLSPVCAMKPKAGKTSCTTLKDSYSVSQRSLKNIYRRTRMCLECKTHCVEIR